MPELSLTDELLLVIATLDEDTLEELEITETFEPLDNKLELLPKTATFDEDAPEELGYSGIGSISGAQEKSNNAKSTAMMAIETGLQYKDITKIIYKSFAGLSRVFCAESSKIYYI